MKLLRIFRLAAGFHLLAAICLMLQGSVAHARDAQPTPKTDEGLQIDRWVEIDLYWFDRGGIERSCREFWKRFAPLYEGVGGWRGVILNVGWNVDYIVTWSGDLDQRIPFPPGLEQDPWFKVSGLLTGTTAERVAGWKERFSRPVDRLKKEYEPWTYRNLKMLAETLPRIAKEEYGLTQIRVGALTLGWKKIYQSRFLWPAKHPEAFDGDFNEGALLSAVRLKADSTPVAAFPRGVPEGTRFYELFGRQWGCLSKDVGLSAIVLRDSMLLQTQYGRGKLIENPERARLLHEGAAGLVRATKKANPNALVLGYSNGASAMSDWRCNGVDLETIFHEGHLDAWIDQTWAGAWNEVGVRAGDFWNNPHQGWTYQLTYMLLHAAMLADTKVRHYPLVETFDAWESWDVLGTVPERLKWGIWAYSHAAVKTPRGIKIPQGTYISWGNQGTRLLEPRQVEFLAAEINAAARDALATTEVYGPTLVYCRDAQAWQNAHAPGKDIKEWLDEQIGTVAKWSVPVGSITRIEYLPRVRSEVFVVGTPAHLRPDSLRALTDLIEQGQPMMLVGSPDGGVDPKLLRLAGLSAENGAAKTDGKSRTATRAKLGDAGELTAGLPAEFEIIQRPVAVCRVSGNASSDGSVVVLYAVEGSPALTLNTAGRRKVSFWDPPMLVSLPSRPLIEGLGGVESYVLAARALNALLSGVESPKAASIAPREPVALLAWRGLNETRSLLAANLDEGLNLDVAKSRAVPLEQYRKKQVPEDLDAYVKPDRQIRVNLPVSWSPPGKRAVPQTADINLSAAGSVRLRY